MSTDASSASSFFAITKSDTVDFPYLVRGIYVGGAGNVVAITEGGEAVTFSSVGAGSILPVKARRVNSTNTTATNMVGLF